MVWKAGLVTSSGTQAPPKPENVNMGTSEKMIGLFSGLRQNSNEQAHGRDAKGGAESHQEGGARQAQVIHFKQELAE